MATVLDEELDQELEAGENSGGEDIRSEPQESVLDSNLDLTGDEPESPVTGDTGAGSPEGDAEFPSQWLETLGISEAQARASFGDFKGLQQAYASELMNRSAQRAQQLQHAHLQSLAAQQQRAQQSQQSQQEALRQFMLQNFQVPEGYSAEEEQVLTEWFNGMVNQVNAHYAPMLYQQQQDMHTMAVVLNQMVQQNQQSAVQYAEYERLAASQEFDQFCNDLPEEWHAILGKETPQEGTPEWNARNAVYSRMEVLQDGQYGMPGLTQQDLYNLAIQATFPRQHAGISRQQVVNEVGKRKGQAIARPSARRADALTKEDAALEALNAKLREFGVDENASIEVQ